MEGGTGHLEATVRPTWPDITVAPGLGFVLPSHAERASRPRPGRRAPGRREGLPSMEPRYAATRVPDPDAADFIRFCFRRRRVGWPELYDEMCAVAARGLYKGLGTEDLAAHGIGFGLFDMPALAAMASGIVAEEQARRRPVSVVIAPVESTVEASEAVTTEAAITQSAVTAAVAAVDVRSDAVVDRDQRGERSVRFAAVPAGA
jgi:hypothetical protein